MNGCEETLAMSVLLSVRVLAVPVDMIVTDNAFQFYVVFRVNDRCLESSVGDHGLFVLLLKTGCLNESLVLAPNICNGSFLWTSVMRSFSAWLE